jgi:polysaccharide export outer membrane protein
VLPSVGDAGIMRPVSPAYARGWLACALLALAAPLCAQTQSPTPWPTDLPPPAPVNTSAPASTASTGSTAGADASAYYVVHPGDVLVINFRYTPEFNDEITVGPDGRGVTKAAGDITLAGRTLPEIQQEIIHGSTDKLVNPEVAVSLKSFEAPNVVVAGEVQKPGQFDLRKATTALQAILMAGGPKEDSAMNHVYLFRRINADTAEVHVLQLGHYESSKRSKEDMLLQPGDMILVNRDALEKIGRFMKTFNLGVYFNPIGSSGLF